MAIGSSTAALLSRRPACRRHRVAVRADDLSELEFRAMSPAASFRRGTTTATRRCPRRFAMTCRRDVLRRSDARPGLESLGAWSDTQAWASGPEGPRWSSPLVIGEPGAHARDSSLEGRAYQVDAGLPWFVQPLQRVSFVQSSARASIEIRRSRTLKTTLRLRREPPSARRMICGPSDEATLGPPGRAEHWGEP
jgi:hypothetical protein